MADSIAELRARFGLTPGECPTSTVTIARWDANVVEVYTLGDSPAVVCNMDAEPVSVYDGRLELVGAEYREMYRAHLRAGRGYDDELSELISRLQLAERAQRNKQGGYWIAESEPAAAGQGIIARFRLDETRQIMLASDGAAADVVEYHRHTWNEVCEIGAKASLREYLQGIHAAEESDYNGVRWPRAKRHDDKTVVVANLAQC